MKFLNNLRVLYKLLFLAGGGIVGILTVAYVAYTISYSGIGSAHELEQIVNISHNMGNADMMHDAISNDIYKALHAIRTDPSLLPEIQREFDAHYAFLYESMWYVKKNVKDTALSAEITAAAQDIDKYLESGKSVMHNTSADSEVIAGKIKEFDELYRKLEVELGSLGNHIAAYPQHNIESITVDAKKNTITVAIVVGITLFFGIIASVMITRSFTSSFATLKSISQDVAAGNYSSDIAAGRTDELGDVFSTLQSMTQTLTRREMQAREHSQALFSLTTNKTIGSGDLLAALREILETDAKVMNIERVSVWLFDESKTKIELLDLYEKSHDRHTSGMTLDEHQYRTYFAALRADRVIAAHDAHKDTRTSEFSEGYLTPLGISSLLDTPVHLRGEMVGLVCHEQVGERITWSTEHERFAGSIADLVAVALESAERKRAEEKTLALATFQKAILDNAGYAIIAGDTEGIITSFNTKAEKMLGYSAEEMIGKLSPAVFHDINEVVARAAEFSDELGQSITPGFDVFVAKARLNLPNEHEWTYIRKDGSRLPVLLSVTAMRDSEGHITGYLGLAADITERKCSEEELRQLSARLVLANRASGAGVWDYNAVTNTLAWDDQMYKLYGVNKEEVHNAYDAWLAGVHPDDKERRSAEIQMALRGEKEFDTEFRVCWPEGSIRHIKAIARVQRDESGKPLNMIGTSLDITKQKRAVQELQQKTTQLEGVAANVPGVVFEFYYRPESKTMGFYFVGRRSKDYFDLDDDPVTFYDEFIARVPDNERKKFFSSIGQAVKTFSLWRYEGRFRKLSGEEIWFRGQADPAMRGKEIIFVGFLMDITERKLADNELRRALRELDFQKYALDQHAIVAITDIHGTITYANERFSQISQYTQEELIGQNHSMLNSGYHGRDFFAIMWATIARGDVWHGELRNRKKDGSYYWVGTTIAPLTNETGKPSRYIAIHTDITERKEAEYELLRAKQLADAANQAKSEFLANMSHEIRTPMNSVLGFSELLKDRVSDEKSKSYVQGILTSGKALLSLINDILDLSKIEAGKLELQMEPTDPYAICSEVAQVFAFRAEEKGLVLDVSINPAMPRSLILDEVRVRQILLNLIGNAIKFTETGSVSVRADCMEYNGDVSRINLIFSVQDTGIGIPPQQQARIFEAFTQQEGQRTRKYGGTGLGLSITKRLIDMMGGRITVESAPEQGAKFIVILPGVALATVSAESSRGSMSEHFKNIKFTGGVVLVVEDIVANREVFQGFLTGHDIKVIEADNGLEGAAKAAEYLPDLIFMDIHMPVMDGYESLKIIRSKTHTQHIPVVALTASALSDEAKKIDKIFNAYLRKPVSRDEIYGLLQKYLPYATVEQHADYTERQSPTKQTDVIDTPEHIEIMRGILPKWKKIRTMMSIDDIEQFAAEIQRIADEHSIISLQQYSQKLALAVENFDIEQANMIFLAYLKLLPPLT